ncbi:MAG: hypothetical protein WCI51_02300 [Lentisphaerota bacterium]
MHSFKDNKGVEWVVEVNMATVKRVKNALGINIADLDNREFMQKLKDDIIFLIDLLYLTCKEQADKRAITDEAFASLIFGDVLEQAVSAFLESYVDFFPAGTRQRLRAAQNLMSPVIEKALAAIDQKLGINQSSTAT